MMGGVSPETCRASYKNEIKFWFIVASCWIFFVNYTMMHGSTNIKFTGVLKQHPRINGIIATWTHLWLGNGSFSLINLSSVLRQLSSQWQYVACYPTDSCSSHERNVGEHSGFAEKKRKHSEAHRWNICADLKGTAMLTGLQGGYSIYCCF